ncbi:hypothetical protein HY493_04890 [Candidatus Woesearchaeota archaeon]|nr:hypothetical protein [Candidatus Woesearchaeota archaeon]
MTPLFARKPKPEPVLVDPTKGLRGLDWEYRFVPQLPSPGETNGSRKSVDGEKLRLANQTIAQWLEEDEKAAQLIFAGKAQPVCEQCCKLSLHDREKKDTPWAGIKHEDRNKFSMKYVRTSVRVTSTAAGIEELGVVKLHEVDAQGLITQYAVKKELVELLFSCAHKECMYPKGHTKTFTFYRYSTLAGKTLLVSRNDEPDNKILSLLKEAGGPK